MKNILIIITLFIYLAGCSEKTARKNKSLSPNDNKDEGIQSNSLFSEIESTYGVKIIMKATPELFHPSWRLPPINAKIVQIDENEVLRYPMILKNVLSKYPKKVLLKNLKKIVLAKSLSFYGLQYGGTYSTYTVYLTSKGISRGYTNDYLINSIHHEFSSILFRNYNFPKEKWKSLNLKGFKYTNNSIDGGIEALKAGKAGLIGSHLWYKQGFLAEYSISALEEDFNLYSASILTNPIHIKKLAKKYTLIKKKLDLWLSFYNSIDINFKKNIFNK
ncbi:MAG: hypothetical protein COA79_21890 [Planctomycetota bacterium]|nr:MAG: hypothetical protein COA79_21890 [Planctomycetota bacterium]